MSGTMLNLKVTLINLAIFLTTNIGQCSIDGVSYMDPIMIRPHPGLYPPGEDPCNPLYWYPRNIPEYCYYRKFPILGKPVEPALPMPLPVPVPQPPYGPMIPMPPPPAPMPVLPPLPYGIPIVPSNPMLPIAPPMINPYAPAVPHNPYMNNIEQTGMVPGLPGLVTKDGGINILPFSDVYSDMIEKHKNRMIRRRLQKLIQEYEDFPNSRSYRRLRKYVRKNM